MRRGSALLFTLPILLPLLFVSSPHVLHARKPREALWPHNLPIRGNASSNYRTPAVHRAGPPPRTVRNSDCWYSKKIKIRVSYTYSKLHRVNPKERSARFLPISDQRICSLQRCPGPFESGHLSKVLWEWESYNWIQRDRGNHKK